MSRGLNLSTVIVSTSILLTTLGLPHAFAGPAPGDLIAITMDKPYYMPGDEVTLTIKSEVAFHQGQIVEFSLLEGSLIGHVVIFETQKVNESADNSLVRKFTLPDHTDFSVYFVRVIIHNPEGGNYAVQTATIFLRQGINTLSITDFQVDTAEVAQGGYVQLSYKVKDGTGRPFYGAESSVGICDNSTTNKPSYSYLNPDHPSREERTDPAFAGCSLFYL